MLCWDCCYYFLHSTILVCFFFSYYILSSTYICMYSIIIYNFIIINEQSNLYSTISFHTLQGRSNATAIFARTTIIYAKRMGIALHRWWKMTTKLYSVTGKVIRISNAYKFENNYIFLCVNYTSIHRVCTYICKKFKFIF